MSEQVELIRVWKDGWIELGETVCRDCMVYYDKTANGYLLGKFNRKV